MSSVHNFSWADEFFSIEGLEPYLDGTGRNYPSALEGYARDLMALCESALWINLFEIALRNALSKQIYLTIALGSGEWFQAIAPHLTENGRGAISMARKRITKGGRQVTGATMTAALPLGFWVNLFGRRHETSLWTPALRRAFPNLQRPSRHFVNAKLLAIYRIRNHIAHQGLITVEEASLVKIEIAEVLSWISGEGLSWARVNAPRIL